MFAQEGADFFDAPEPAHGFEGGKCDCHFGFVVRVAVVRGVSIVQLGGEPLVGVGLDGQHFAAGEDFEQEGQLPAQGYFQGGAVAEC